MEIHSLVDVIVALDACPSAKEEGARLAEAYVERFSESDSQNFKVIAVEMPWSLWLEENTLLIGCKDARMEDADGPFILELKTIREQKRTKAGAWYKGDGEDAWLEKMRSGHQTAIYALSEMEATGAPSIRVRVRAAVKSRPVELWPEREADGIFTYDEAYLTHLRSALLAKAAQVRGARLSGLVPWQWTEDYRCTHIYGRECPFLAPYCARHTHPVGRRGVFSATDPGAAAIAQALEVTGRSANDPALVILSASAYSDYATCMEYGRIVQDGLSTSADADNDSMALQIGSVFHSAISCYHKELQKSQLVPALLP